DLQRRNWQLFLRHKSVKNAPAAAEACQSAYRVYTIRTRGSSAQRGVRPPFCHVPVRRGVQPACVPESIGVQTVPAPKRDERGVHLTRSSYRWPHPRATESPPDARITASITATKCTMDRPRRSRRHTTKVSPGAKTCKQVSKPGRAVHALEAMSQKMRSS